MIDTDKYIKEIIDNIGTDRALTLILLNQTREYIMGATDKKDKFYANKDLGLVASKYIETLQRSNEQLVKLLAIVRKDRGAAEEITDEERDLIFEDLKKDNTKNKSTPKKGTKQ